MDWYEMTPASRAHIESHGVERRALDGKFGRAKTIKLGKKGFPAT